MLRKMNVLRVYTALATAALLAHAQPLRANSVPPEWWAQLNVAGGCVDSHGGGSVIDTYVRGQRRAKHQQRALPPR